VPMSEVRRELALQAAERDESAWRATELLLDIEMSLSAVHRRVAELHFGIGEWGPCDIFEISMMTHESTFRVNRLLGEALGFAKTTKERACRKAA